MHRTLITLSAMTTAPKPIIIVYSDDASVRAAIVAALGRQVASDIPEHQIQEFATGPALRAFVDRKGVSGELRANLFILDGEAVPEGGMGIARQLKDEVFNCPPVLVLVGRVDDRWLATWSRADAVVAHPIDPRAVVNACLELLKSRNSISQ